MTNPEITEFAALAGDVTSQFYSDDPYFDEDSMSKRLVRALRSRHVDVVTAFEVGFLGHPDEEHLEYAAQQGRVLYSCNTSDFCRIHKDWLTLGKSHAGIVLDEQQQFSVGVQLRALMRLEAQRSALEMCNHLAYLSNWIER